jgi:uncharacterized protein YbjT (DUF2867 family)
MADTELKVALLAGATGLVGSHLLNALLAAPDFGRVYAITRRPLTQEHPRLANRIVQFDKLEAQLKGTVCHVAFCCLGTAQRQAGSEAAFRRVDVDTVLAFARAARAAQARRFVFVSSVGANAQSRHFYLRVKAEVEQALATLGFPSLDILQPGALMGWRRELRPLELGAMLVMPLVNPFLTGTREQYRAISARTVAEGMIGAARSARKGVYKYTYANIRALARSKPARFLPGESA